MRYIVEYIENGKKCSEELADLKEAFEFFKTKDKDGKCAALFNLI